MNRRHLAALLATAAASETVYVAVFLVHYALLAHYREDTDMAGITNHSEVAVSAFIASMCVLFGLMMVAALVARKCDSNIRTTGFVLGTSVIFVVTLVFVYPITAIDIFNYVAESNVLVTYHQNPIFVAPAAHPHDLIDQLSGGWMRSGAPYGPFGLVVDAWPFVFVGANLLWNLLLLKLTFGLLLVVEAVLVYLILVQVSPDRALVGTVFIAWNPLLLFEIVANGHNDIVMLVMATVGVFALIKLDAAQTTGWLWVFQASGGLILLTSSALVKFVTLLLLPLALPFVLSRMRPLGTRIAAVATGLAGSAVLLLVAYAPFWRGVSTWSRATQESSFGLQSLNSAMLTLFPEMSKSLALDLGRTAFAAVFIWAVFQCWGDPSRFLSACTVVLGGFLGLAAGSVKIWYLGWPSVFAALGSWKFQAVVGLMSLGATLSAALYAWGFVWFGNSGQTFPNVNAFAYFMAFGPAVIALALLAVCRVWTQRMGLLALTSTIPRPLSWLDELGRPTKD